ncbi:MAG TPA: hypothetical protein VLV88_15805 [Terriglobales bacterium]|nr:hypothetical protein [Terriglobales bacterium]
MQESRRRLLTAFAGAVGLIIVKPSLSFSQGHPVPPPIPSPNAPTNPYDPAGLDGPPPSNPAVQRHIDQQNQQHIRDDVHHLYALASELKSKVDKTNETLTLDVSFVKEAQAIEKLAKQIKSLAKG